MSTKIFYDQLRVYQAVVAGSARNNTFIFQSYDRGRRLFTIWREFGNDERPQDCFNVYDHMLNRLTHIPISNVPFLVPENQDVGDVAIVRIAAVSNDGRGSEKAPQLAKEERQKKAAS